MTKPATCKTLGSLLLAAIVLQGCTTTPRDSDSASLFSGSSTTDGNAVSDTETAASSTSGNSHYVVDSEQKVVLATNNVCVRTIGWAADHKIVECQSSTGTNLISFNGSALFEFDSSELSTEGRIKLDQLTNRLNAQDEIKQIEIIGHADSIGSDGYNQSLSERRALVTKNYLQQSLQNVLVNARGVGESSPTASNDTDEGRRLNRRVDVQIAAKVAR